MGTFFNCKEVSAKIDADTVQKLQTLETAGVQARLALFQIGDKADESAYASAIIRKCELLGVEAELHRFPEDVPSDEYLTAFRQANDHAETDGLLLLQPLPRHIEAEAIKRAVRPEKDVDGFGIHQYGSISMRRPASHAPLHQPGRYRNSGALRRGSGGDDRRCGWTQPGRGETFVPPASGPQTRL